MTTCRRLSFAVGYPWSGQPLCLCVSDLLPFLPQPHTRDSWALAPVPSRSPPLPLALFEAAEDAADGDGRRLLHQR